MTASAYEPIDLGPMTITFSILGEDSGGAMTVSRCDVDDGAGLPVPHFHDAFEEAIYGLEGVTTFTVNGEDIEVGPGEAYCIRRGAVHTFEAKNGATSFVAIATPGIFGPDYFIELQDALRAGGENGPDPRAVGEVMLRHGLTPVA